MVGYLLENGVGEFLQFCIVPFNFLQLILKLKEKGETELRQRAAYLCWEWGFFRKERQTELTSPHPNE